MQTNYLPILRELKKDHEEGDTHKQFAKPRYRKILSARPLLLRLMEDFKVWAGI